MPSTSSLFLIPFPTHPGSLEKYLLVKKQHSTWIHAEARKHIAKQLSITEKALILQKSTHGKPFYVHQSKPIQQQFSVSHTPKYSILLIHNTDCAIDIEQPRKRKHLTKLQKKVAKHFAYPVKEDHFYKSWTLLEAWCKYHGDTLWQTLASPSPLTPDAVHTYLHTGQLVFDNLYVENIQPTEDSTACIIRKFSQKITKKPHNIPIYLYTQEEMR